MDGKDSSEASPIVDLERDNCGLYMSRLSDGVLIYLGGKRLKQVLLLQNIVDEQSK